MFADHDLASPRVAAAAEALAGRLGTGLLAALLERGWLARRPRDRALTVTETGAARLSELGLWPLAAGSAAASSGRRTYRPA